MFNVLEMKGFPIKYINQIKRIVQSGGIAVMVNGQVGKYFRTGKGLMQGGALPPILFNQIIEGARCRALPFLKQMIGTFEVY